jgi:type I restriction enzyme S subunit
VAKLGDVADLALGKMLDQKKNKGTNRKYLANVNVRWGAFNLDHLKEMPFQDSEMERYGLRYGDIVMCEGGEPGRCAIWKNQLPGMMYQKALHRIRPRDGLDFRFLYYHFLLLGRKNGFDGLFTGSAIKHMPKDKLALVEIPLPPLPVQRRIADILSAYDDLIENNRRRIAILEETARLAYRKWFGNTKAPTSTLGEICKTFGGGTPKTSVKEYWDGDVPWVVPTDVTRNPCLALLDTERKITALGLEKSSAKMLPANAILLTSRASVGYFAVADFPVCTNQGFIGIVPHDTSLRWYILFNLMSRVEEIRNNAKGATFPEISRTRFRDMEIAVPDEESTTAFNAIVTPLMTQVRTLAKQSAQLTSARDILLPKLINPVSRKELSTCMQG